MANIGQHEISTTARLTSATGTGGGKAAGSKRPLRRPGVNGTETTQSGDIRADADGFEPEDDGNPAPSAYNPATGKLYLASGQCHDCVFAKAGRCLDLGPGRLKELADDLRARDDFLLCHNTYAPLGPPGAQPATCRGFFDAYGTHVTAIRMAMILGLVEEIDPPAKDACSQYVREVPHGQR